MNGESSADIAKKRLTWAISHDRYQQGFGEQAGRTGRGCGFDTMACVFRTYYPDRILPRMFETEPTRYSPDLGLELAEFIDFTQQHRTELGFEVSEVVLSPLILPIKLGEREEKSAELFLRYKDLIKYAEIDLGNMEGDLSDIFGFNKFIPKNDSPMAALFSKPSGEAHVEPITESTEERRLETLNDLQSEGYSLQGYISFSRLSSPS